MSKMYYKCADCGVQISKAGVVQELMKAVYCWHCVNYDIDVVIAYE